MEAMKQFESKKPTEAPTIKNPTPIKDLTPQEK
jgi:hypothetical protein